MMQKSDSIAELAKALNRVQAELQPAKESAENPFFKSRYADLLSVWEACRRPLAENGLAVIQTADATGNGSVALETMLVHTSGEWVSGRLEMPLVKLDPQAVGSAITYARRYSLSALIGLATEADDDAQAAMTPQTPKPAKKPTPKAVEAVADPTAPVEPIPITDQNLDKFFNQCQRNFGFDEAMVLTELGLQDRTGITDLREAWAKLKAVIEPIKD